MLRGEFTMSVKEVSILFKTITYNSGGSRDVRVMTESVVVTLIDQNTHNMSEEDRCELYMNEITYKIFQI